MGRRVVPLMAAERCPGQGEAQADLSPSEDTPGAGTLCNSLTCEETAALPDGDLPHQQVGGAGLRELAPLQSLLQHLLFGV